MLQRAAPAVGRVAASAGRAAVAAGRAAASAGRVVANVARSAGSTIANTARNVGNSIQQGAQRVSNTASNLWTRVTTGAPAPNPNDLHHIFNNPTHNHNLNSFLQSFRGNEVHAYNAVQRAISNSPGLPQSGVFEAIVVQVNGFAISVKGTVIDGVVRIGTFYIPG